MTKVFDLLFTSVLTAFVVFFGGDAEASVKKYDLVVIGGGTGGSVAAIQAARSGLRVAIVEESDFIGGQMTGAAVSTLDDVGRTRTGLYAEFISHVRDHYGKLGVKTNICLWGADTIATEPSVAQAILRDMMQKTGKIDLFMRTSVSEVTVEDGSLTGVVVDTMTDAKSSQRLLLGSSVFIDATECGDFLPLAGASYRLGNSISPNIDLDANVQDITYVAVVRKYDGGLPDNLRMPGTPPDYEKYLPKFRQIVAENGNTWPGKYPFDIQSHNAYRALPDPENRVEIIGDSSSTWSFITKTCINWANDYPGESGDQPGMSVRYIEDAEYRREAERDAMLRTLAFIWYMQSELGMTDWSVDNSQGFGGFFSNDWDTAGDKRLPKEFAHILKHFPPFPYVREGRRVVGLDTLRQSDISRDITRGRAYKNYSSGLALGEYPVDVHGSHLDRYMEHDLGETSDSFPRTWEGSTGVFQVPFEVFIPEKVDGLIAAEKNLSVSRMVNGAIRLHPITMHTGQAAGAIAAEAVKSRVRPRAVNILSVQRALMDSGSYIALDSSADTSSSDCYWKGVQWASLYAALDKITATQFGVTLPIKSLELKNVLGIAYPDKDFGLSSLLNPVYEEYISRADFLNILGEFAPYNSGSFFGCSDLDLTLKRGEAVALVFESLKLE